jgi:uncharacterized delta-60 repeat protein
MWLAHADVGRFLGRWRRWLAPLVAAVLAAVFVGPPVSAHPTGRRGGSLDRTFGTGGQVTTAFPGYVNASASAVALQPDGHLVAAGTVIRPEDPFFNQDLGLVRYDRAGRLDPTFGSGGRVSTGFTPSSVDTAEALAVQRDGKLVVAGRSCPDNFTDPNFLIARYLRDGSLDTSFGSGGLVTTDFGGHDVANALVVQADGKLVAGGIAAGLGGQFALVRYNPDGSLDTTFGTGGKVTTDFVPDVPDYIEALVVEPDGRLVAAGVTEGNDALDFALARYNRDGSLDTTFGTGGKVTTDFAGGGDHASALVLQPDGKYVAAGMTVRPQESNVDFGLARYRHDGSLDPSFGVAGLVTTDFAGREDVASALVVLSDGTLVAAGAATPTGTLRLNFALARYRRDGRLDRRFGDEGRVITDFAGGTSYANSLAVQPHGKLVAAGIVAPGLIFSDEVFGLARYRLHG